MSQNQLSTTDQLLKQLVSEVNWLKIAIKQKELTVNVAEPKSSGLSRSQLILLGMFFGCLLSIAVTLGRIAGKL